MAGNTGANLRVRISADLDDIKQGLGLLRGELAKVKADAARAAPDAGSWESSIGRIRSSLVKLAGAYVGIQTVTRGIGALFSSLERADKLEKLSQSAGVSVTALSKLAYAANLSGADVDLLGKGLRKLSVDATANQGILGKLGIEIRDASGNTRDASALFLDLADVFATLPDGAEKTALAAKLLGERFGPALIPLLNEGKQGLIDLGIEAEQTGNVLDETTGPAASKFKDNLERLQATARGVANETLKNLIPSVAGYVEAAFGAAQSSNAAAEGGKAFAIAIKALAVPVILAKNLLEAFGNVLLFIGSAAPTVGTLIARSLTRPIAGFSNALLEVAAGKTPLAAIYDQFSEGSKGISADAKNTLDALRAQFSAMKTGVSESAQDIINIGKLFDDSTGKAADGAKEIGKGTAQASPEAAKLLALVRSILGGDASEKGAATQKKIKDLAESTVLAQDEVKRAQKALDEQFADGSIGVNDYYSKRVALQQQLIDLQIAQLQSELALTTELDRRRRIEEQITVLQRDRSQVAVEAARDQARAEAKATAVRAEDLRNRASSLTGGLSAQEQSISAQIQAGSLGYLEGEQRLQAVRTEALDKLKELRQEQADYIASLAPDDPNMAGAREGLLGIDTAIANVTASMQKMRQDTMDVGVSALRGFFENLRDGAMSAGDAFRALVADFARGIYDMLAEATAKRLVGAVADLFGGASGGDAQGAEAGAVALTGAAAATTAAGTAVGLGAAKLGISAGALAAAADALLIANRAGSVAGGGGVGKLFGLAHGGGVAGALQMYRNVDPMVFGAAPRYHSGGIAGLNSNEIPAILQRGETIRTRQQEAALQARMGGGQGAAPAPIRNIIVFSDAELADALSGAAGERVVVNHVRRNRGAVNG